MRDTQRLDGAAYGFGDGRCLPVIGARQQHNELFAAITRRQVARASGLLHQRLGQQLQQFVALLMAIAVVVAFEVVRIQEQKRERRGLPCRRRPLAFERLVEGASIGNAGQSICLRARFQLLLEGLAQAHFASEKYDLRHY
ncbi:hypothetical protein D3C71_1722450 [compost metagenome]